MKLTRPQILFAASCLLLGLALLFRVSNSSTGDSSISGDQAASISRLYESDAALQQQADALSDQLTGIKSSDETNKSSLNTAAGNLQNMRIADGQVDVTGPGVTVIATGDLTVFQLQDLVNELRNASAEAVAVNGVRVVARTAIAAANDGKLTVDGQAVSSPYRLDAIGEPDTLAHAMQRKGGLVALLVAQNPGLNIELVSHSIPNKAGWLTLPKSTANFNWVYGQDSSAP